MLFKLFPGGVKRRNKPVFSVFMIFLILSALSCGKKQENAFADSTVPTNNTVIETTSILVLGTVQDAGSPHIACTKDCCRELFQHPDPSRKVVSLGLIDPQNKKSYLLDATPDLPVQMKMLKKYAAFSDKETPDGVLLTHAHIGHYTGLMYFGKEAMYSSAVPVYAMPVMKSFLENNGPWSLLVQNKNITIQEMANRRGIALTSNLQIMPIRVPHREEYSEVVGFIISGPNKKALFIPDIDKWSKWDMNIEEAIAAADYAFIDGTFYDGNDINNRDISEIPHPFIIESMARFKVLDDAEKQKIYFIHLNHTNPALNEKSEEFAQIVKNGFHVAKFEDIFEL